ncbi:uncharacterized protein RAG0_14077 [Rhynchosporium agropyri]|uniref:CCHC-type domain-containing protein n=1 Tax=Rhynchosporium agropyri TaxID=914238 RepID=A0A1E1LFF7_9HELO|nr:uncharacterized protein RAG0_14077 [Rhynchosporium agropyri]
MTRNGHKKNQYQQHFAAGKGQTASNDNYGGSKPQAQIVEEDVEYEIPRPSLVQGNRVSAPRNSGGQNGLRNFKQTTTTTVVGSSRNSGGHNGLRNFKKTTTTTVVDFNYHANETDFRAMDALTLINQSSTAAFQTVPNRAIMAATGPKKGNSKAKETPTSQTRNPAQSGSQTKPTRQFKPTGADLKVCGNCGTAGHTLSRCIGPTEENGFIMGCPHCNTKDHLWEQCSSYDASRHAHVMLFKRQHRPQFGSSILLSDLPEGKQPVGDTPGGKWHGKMPWTTETAASIQAAAENYWAGYQYQSDPAKDAIFVRDGRWLKKGGGRLPNVVPKDAISTKVQATRPKLRTQKRKNEVPTDGQEYRLLKRRSMTSASPEADKRPKLGEHEGFIKAESLLD